jgi:hypothetical protein
VQRVQRVQGVLFNGFWGSRGFEVLEAVMHFELEMNLTTPAEPLEQDLLNP